MKSIVPKFVSVWRLFGTLSLIYTTSAFVSNNHLSSQHPSPPTRSSRRPTTTGGGMSSSSSVLGAGVGDDLFENFKRLWGGGDKAGDNSKESNLLPSDDEAAGTTLIASIPVQSIKPGGLRLFLMFYCMGMQNTPDRGTWQANQPSSKDYVVEMFFRDASAMLSIELLDEEVRITRCGSVPSTPYLMQESVIVQGVLDELEQCAFDESVNREDRLLVPEPSNAIDLARGSLSFG